MKTLTKPKGKLKVQEAIGRKVDITEKWWNCQCRPRNFDNFC